MCVSQFSPSAVWDLSIGFRFLGLVTNAFYPTSCLSGWLYTATKWTGVVSSMGAWTPLPTLPLKHRSATRTQQAKCCPWPWFGMFSKLRVSFLSYQRHHHHLFCLFSEAVSLWSPCWSGTWWCRSRCLWIHREIYLPLPPGYRALWGFSILK